MAYVLHKKALPLGRAQRVDKPSHSLSVLRAGAHECQIRSAPVLVLPRLQRLSITLKRKRQRAKIKFILALCQQSEALPLGRAFSFILFLQIVPQMLRVISPSPLLPLLVQSMKVFLLLQFLQYLSEPKASPLRIRQ